MGWVRHDVTPELAREVSLIWKSEYELEEEFKEQLKNALYELQGVRPELCGCIEYM